VRDLEQPRELRLGRDAALQRAMRVQERRLEGVLGLVARAELVDAEPEDLPRVAFVEILGRVGIAGGALNVCCTTDGRDCGYRRPRQSSLTGQSRNPP
jgi:hypothetical protein